MGPYVLEAATLGGVGGTPFEHNQQLAEHGLHQGCGAGGAHLAVLKVEAWGWPRYDVMLSHTAASYVSNADAGRVVALPGTGNVRSHNAVTFSIEPDERVAVVRADSKLSHVAGGHRCLTWLQMETEQLPADAGPPGRRRVVGIGDEAPQPEVTLSIPPGLTLAGIRGRAGDSWDQLCLLVCPWLPAGGAWSPRVHRHCAQPFKDQVRALLCCMCTIAPSLAALVHERLAAALFRVTFMGSHDEGGGGDADYISSWMQAQLAAAVVGEPS